jgi:hypothetical protein
MQSRVRATHRKGGRRRLSTLGGSALPCCRSAPRLAHSTPRRRRRSRGQVGFGVEGWAGGVMRVKSGKACIAGGPGEGRCARLVFASRPRARAVNQAGTKVSRADTIEAQRTALIKAHCPRRELARPVTTRGPASWAWLMVFTWHSLLPPPPFAAPPPGLRLRPSAEKFPAASPSMARSVGACGLVHRSANWRRPRGEVRVVCRGAGGGWGWLVASRAAGRKLGTPLCPKGKALRMQPV